MQNGIQTHTLYQRCAMLFHNHSRLQADQKFLQVTTYFINIMVTIMRPSIKMILCLNLQERRKVFFYNPLSRLCLLQLLRGWLMASTRPSWSLFKSSKEKKISHSLFLDYRGRGADPGSVL